MRKVNSITAAVDKDNFKPIEPPPETKQIIGRVPSKSKKNEKDDIIFTNKFPAKTGRPKNLERPKTAQGVAEVAQDLNTPIEAFNFFMNDEMVDDIVNFTNRRIVD